MARGTGSQLVPSPSRKTGCSGSSFSSPSLAHFPSHRCRPPCPGIRARRRVPIFPRYIPLGTRRQIPVGPRSAKSAQRDGKLQQYWPLGPPPEPSRNSRPWTLAPQLIHSWGAGPPPYAGTDVRAPYPCEAEDRTGSGAGRQAGEYGPVRPRCPCAASIASPTGEPQALVPRSLCSVLLLVLPPEKTALSGATRGVPEKCRLIGG